MVPHVAFGDVLQAVRAHDPLPFGDFLPDALVVGWPPKVANLAEHLVFAEFNMAGITPFATMGTMHALRKVGLHQLPGPVRLSTLGTRVL